jgi:apolipoprotein N-acyltransferase
MTATPIETPRQTTSPRRLSLDHPAGRFAAAIVSGALFYVATALDPVWWAAWLAPIPLLVAAFRASQREVWLLSMLAGLLGGASTVGYFAGFIGVAGAAVLLVVQALTGSAAVLVTRAYVLRSRHPLVTFVFPTLSAGVDLIMTVLGQGATAGRISYGQMDAAPVIQIASVAGTAGIAFTVSLFSALVAVAWYRRGAIARPWLAYGLPAAVLTGVLGFGVLRLTGAAAAPTLAVGLAAISHPVDRDSRIDTDLWARYAGLVSSLARQGARLVLLPEKSATLDPPAADALQRRLGQLAAENHLYLALAVDLTRGTHKENHEWLFAPDGDLTGDYVKEHLVIGFERQFLAGHDKVVATIDGHRVGLEICHDLDFPALSRAYASLGVSALLVPASDFRVDDQQHARAAMLRGVEDGFSIIRSAGWGLVSASDRYGRVTAFASDVGRPEASLVTEVRLAPASPTLYAHFGDVFGWLAVAASAGLMLWLVLRRMLGRAAP